MRYINVETRFGGLNINSMGFNPWKIGIYLIVARYIMSKIGEPICDGKTESCNFHRQIK